MTRSPIEPKLLKELEAVAAEVGCELLHTEFKGGTLRLILDRPEGVTLEDCERVSRQASALLDVDDFSKGRYVLEVSSPGLDRQLYRPQDYERFVGRAVRVTYSDERTGGRQTVSGSLQAFDDNDGGRATVLNNESGEELLIPLQNIQLAKLEIEL